MFTITKFDCCTERSLWNVKNKHLAKITRVPMNSNFICPCPLFDLFKAWKVLFEFCLTYLDGILQKKRDFIPKFEFYKTKLYTYLKYSKHWLSTVAHTIDCVCRKILNYGLNHGLLFSLFKFLGEKHSKLTWKFRIKI